MIRTLSRALLLIASSALIAGAAAYGLREILPYEQLGRTSPEERFFLWEALLWMIGLALILFGSSAALGSLDLGSTRRPGLEEAYTFSRNVRWRGARFSPAAFWTIGAGATLLVIAGWARASLPA